MSNSSTDRSNGSSQEAESAEISQNTSIIEDSDSVESVSLIFL